MKKITYLINGIIRYALLCIILLSFNAGAQVYLHDFGTAAISSHPYNVAPATLSADLSGSSWTNSTGEFTSFSGASGVALSLANSGGAPTITLTFNVNAGKALDLTSFSFWRVRSGAGAQNWSMTINGIAVGNGTVPTTGASTGTLPANLTGLTGTVRVVLSLSGATGSGTFRLDDFRLNGTTRSSCAGATISSISPLSGPENTIVSIIGSGFETGSGTTGVQFNGMNAAGFTVISDTEIKAIVPALATSGAISVTTNGCTANFSTFTAINSNCPLLSGGTDIYISEVYDQKTGSGGMIEIYNPTNNTITLTGNYILQRYGNITDTTPSTGYILPLTGTIAPGATYLVAANEPDATICAAPPYNITYTSGFNANDKFELLKNNAVIDVVNVPFLQTGFTLIRRPDAAAPSPVYNIVDWNNFLHDDVEPNTYCANLGIHEANNSQPPVTIIAQPLSLSVCESNNAAFTVVMTNATGFTIQWKVLNAAGNWVNVVNDNHYSGANSTTLTITDAPLDFLGNQYYAEAVNGSCRLVSNAVQLTVSPLPVVLAVPTNPTCFISVGSITVVPLFGVGLTYSIDGVNFQASATFANLAPGTYTISVRTLAGCISTTDITVADIPLLPAVPTLVVTQPTCTVNTGSIEITAPLGLGITFSIDGQNFQAGNTFTGLAAGNYTITVQTALGCLATLPVTINPAPVLALPVVNIVQPTCTSPTGTINVTGPLGLDLTYSLDGTNFQAGTAFSGLAAGNYTLTVKSNAGCIATIPVTITPAPLAPVLPVFTVTQPTCTTTTGSITITGPIGGSLTYSINGTTFQAGTSFTNLAPGSYTITVLNGNGCTSVSTPITINPAPTAPAAPTVAATQPTCTTAGTITISAPTGSGFTYSINGTDYVATTTFTPGAGTYNVTVRNSDGCTSVATPVTINPVPTAPAAPTVAATQPTCTTAGTITISAPTGNGFTYSINGTDYVATTTFTPGAGTYNVTVRNSDGCTSVATSATINPVPTAPAAPTVAATQPTCTTAGTITISAPTGSGFTYSINGTDYVASTTFTPGAGTYNVMVRNAAGCTSAATPVTINPAPTAPAAPTVAATQPTCTTAGTITISAPTGNGFTYSINGTDYAATTTFTPGAGTYNVTVRNAAGCTSAATPVTINPAPTAPAAPTVAATQPTCTTAGTITISAPTGNGFTYSINGTDYVATTTFTPGAGTYNVTVRNAAGCTSVATSATINPVPTAPAAPTVAATQPTCTTAGTITISAPTGSGFTYSINGTDYVATTTFTPGAGTYNVTVRNSDGCTSTATPVIINPVPTAPAAPTVAATQPTCTTAGTITISAPTGSGFTYSINGTDYVATTTFTPGAGTYNVTVRNSDGCTSVATPVTINPVPTAPAAPTVAATQPTCTITTGSFTITDPVGNDFTYSVDGGEFTANTTYTNLEPGIYSIVVKNSAGCTSSGAVTITEPEIPAVGQVSIAQPTCTEPTAILTVNTPQGTGWTYSIDGVNYQQNSSFLNLDPGTYNITVKNPEGCISEGVDYVINNIPGLPLISSVEGCRDTAFSRSYIIEALPLDNSFDPASAQYIWRDTAGTIIGNDQSTFDISKYIADNNIALSQAPLEIVLTVTSEGGCSATMPFTVESIFCTIPKGISPNNDGKNDNFDLAGFNISQLSIFNRYGKEVFTRSNYKDEWMGQSDGGDELPTGTYYYVIEVPGREAQTGWVYVNREESSN